MSAAGRAAAPYFSQPVRQVVTMLAILALVAAGGALAMPSVAPVFLANPYVNGVIALVFLIGIVACFWQALQVMGSVRWIVAFTAGQGGTRRHAPRLLAPLAALLRERGARHRIPSTSARSILDSVATRIDESREITRYIVNLLIFLGLLGTFYGLATTVPAVVDTIRSLAPQEGEGSLEVFDRLMTGLEAQLGGMGVAFSSSLLGLAGSLVVGLLELFAGHGQNRFYRELEEWLSTITRVGFAADDDGEGAGLGAMPALVDALAERLEDMQRLFAEAEAVRAVTDRRLGAVAQAVEGLTERLARGSATDAALARVAEGQARLVTLLEEGGGSGGLDAESRMRLRSIDTQLLRVLEELAAGREESVAELRGDIAGLARALRPGGAAMAPAVGPAPQPVPPIRRGGQGAG